MNDTAVNFVREFVHALSILSLGIIVIAIIIGTIKPRMLKFALREFAIRRYVFVSGVFLALLCSTVFIATQSSNNSYQSKAMSETSDMVSFVPDESSDNAKDQAPSQSSESDVLAMNTGQQSTAQAPAEASNNTVTPAQPEQTNQTTQSQPQAVDLQPAAPSTALPKDTVQSDSKPSTSQKDDKKCKDKHGLSYILCLPSDLLR